MMNNYDDVGEEESKKMETEVMAAQVMNKKSTAVRDELSRFLSTPLLRGFDEPWRILLRHLSMSSEVRKAFLNITYFELEGGKAWDFYADLLGEGTASPTYGALEKFWSHVDSHGAKMGDGHTHLSDVLDEAADGFLSWIRESDHGYRGGGSLLLRDWSGVIDEFTKGNSGDVANSIVDYFSVNNLFDVRGKLAINLSLSMRNLDAYYMDGYSAAVEMIAQRVDDEAKLFSDGELEYGTSLTHSLIEVSDEITLDGWARLSSLLEAYNWEWALAAFEWSEVDSSEHCASPLANLRALVDARV